MMEAQGRRMGGRRRGGYVSPGLVSQSFAITERIGTWVLVWTT